MTSEGAKRVGFPVIGTLAGCIANLLSQNQNFAVTDDYRLISAAQNLRPFVIEGHARLEASTGRVVPGFLFKLIWFAVNDIGDLWYVRLLGVGLVGLSVATFLSWFVIKAGITSKPSLGLLALLGALTLLLPGVAATTTWATKTAHLLALPLAMTGGLVATKSKMTAVRWCLVVILIFGSAFSYQHFALFAVLPVAIVAALSSIDEETPRQLKRPFIVMVIGGAAIAANFGVVWLMGDGVLNRISDRPLANRFKELVDVLAKGALLYVDRSFLLVLMSFIVASCVFIMTFKSAKKAWFLLFAIGTSVAGSVLLTFGADGESSFRMVLPTQLTIWLGLGTLGAYVMNVPSLGLVQGKLFVPLAFAGALIIAVISTTGIIRNDIALRNARDWTNTTCELKKILDGDIPERISVRLRPIELSGTNAVRSEIGLTASQIGWLFQDQWNLALRSESAGASLARVPIEFVDDDSVVLNSASYVIDLRTPCVDDAD